MLDLMNNPTPMDDFGIPLFSETIYFWGHPDYHIHHIFLYVARYIPYEVPIISQLYSDFAYLKVG